MGLGKGVGKGLWDGKGKNEAVFIMYISPPGLFNMGSAMPRPASAPSDVSMREDISKGKVMVPL